MAKRKDNPIGLRLTPEDVARADALCGPMAAAAGLDSAAGISRHSVLISAIRLGLAALEAKHRVGTGARKPAPR